MYTYLNDESTGYYEILCNFRMCKFRHVCGALLVILRRELKLYY